MISGVEDPDKINLPDDVREKLSKEFLEDFKKLSPLDQIRFIAGVYKVELNDEPKKDCGKCFGKGIIGNYADSDIPNICTCLIKSPHQFAIKKNRERRRAEDKIKRKYEKLKQK